MERGTNIAIETRGLARSFGDNLAVKGLDLKVRRGELFGLVGPDGAGKSTAIRLLCGILRPTGGEARIVGYDLQTETEQIKARIGYLSQNFTLYGDLTVDENIEFFADLHGVKAFKKRRNELLEFTRLTPFRKRLAGALSGGMKKKLALACTLIHTPELIFLDEPSTGVDPVSRGEFWNILSGILDQGITVFMTTPYLDEAERCHTIGLMNRGSMLRVGSPDDIKAAMPGIMMQAACSDPAAAYRIVREKWPSTRVLLYGDRLRVWLEKDDEEQHLSDRLASRGMTVTWERDEPSLEDAFVAMVTAAGEAAAESLGKESI